MISIETLRSMVSYNPETGVILWRERTLDMCSSLSEMKRWNTRFAGKEAFSVIASDGYKTGELMGHSLKAHRVAWAAYHGYWPEGPVDHVDGSRAANQITNLREATPSENARNVGIPSTNTSGFKGVYWHKGARKWIARIGRNGEKVFLGCFDDPKSAADAYDLAALALHGEFARPNRTAA